jgi:hypothetical protein
MSQAIITTLAGGFVFAFVLNILWGKLVENVGILGGFIAAAFIVGGSWIMNHGAGFIVQGNAAPWVDQAWSVGIGGLAFGIVSKANIRKSIPTIIASLIGGTLAGFILAQMGGSWG